MSLSKYQKQVLQKCLDLETLSEPSAYVDNKRFKQVYSRVASYLDCQALFIPFSLHELNNILCDTIFPEINILEEIQSHIYGLPKEMHSTVFSPDYSEEEMCNEYILEIMKEKNQYELLIGVFDDCIYTIYQTKETNYYNHIKLRIYTENDTTDIATMITESIGYDHEKEEEIIQFLENQFNGDNQWMLSSYVKIN